MNSKLPTWLQLPTEIAALEGERLEEESDRAREREYHENKNRHTGYRSKGYIKPPVNT